MCIIIDANALHSVFIRGKSDHEEFKPVLDWIMEGKGKIVYGGAHYHNEIPPKYLGIFVALRNARKAIRVDDAAVDKYQRELEAKGLKGFNDHHLIAIISVSRCKLLCTKNIANKNDIKCLNNKDLYPRGVSPPSIYSRGKNKDLLCDKNIAECCKPVSKITKNERFGIASVFESL